MLCLILIAVLLSRRWRWDAPYGGYSWRYPYGYGYGAVPYPYGSYSYYDPYWRQRGYWAGHGYRPVWY